MAKKENKPTQCDLILKYIRDFGSISTWEAMMDLGVARLASRIFDLKNKGYKFRKQRIYTSNRYDKKIYYDRYFLVEEQA